MKPLEPPGPANFPISPEITDFREKYYPLVSDIEWNDWKWQNRNRITTFDKLNDIMACDSLDTSFAMGVTPYYAGVAKANTSLQKTIIPSHLENVIMASEGHDPLGEEQYEVVPGLIHRYPDRVLLLVTNYCTVYCRFCTRSRMVGDATQAIKQSGIENAFQYIQNHPEIRDVLISGGDPLTLSDDRLDYILGRLKSVPHVEFIRIGSKIPIVLPQRITPDLIKVLKKHSPLFMSLHFTHPGELTTETVEACNRLADAGIPLGSQTVLLKEVNDDLETMKSLMHKLLKARVRPYYIYQCDQVKGAGHFRTPLQKGIDIIQGLRGYTSGYAVPTLVVDGPIGKIPVYPETMIGSNGIYQLTNYKNKTMTYHDF